MVTNELYLYDRADEYIILWKFGSHAISGYRVTDVGPPKPPHPSVPGSSKKPGLNRVKTILEYVLQSRLLPASRYFEFFFFFFFYDIQNNLRFFDIYSTRIQVGKLMCYKTVYLTFVSLALQKF